MFSLRFLVDGGCFQLFDAASDVLRKIGEDARIIQAFVELGTKTRVAAVEAMDAEAALGDIPDEFLDPIQVHNDFLACLDRIYSLKYQISNNVISSPRYVQVLFVSVLLFFGVAVHFNEGSCHFAIIKSDCG